MGIAAVGLLPFLPVHVYSSALLSPAPCLLDVLLRFPSVSSPLREK